MRVAEIYSSVQGEGLFTGSPSVFVRASGCNLRCQFCDTPFASWKPEGADRSVPAIVRAVRQWSDCQHVVLTGGEPMLFAELIPLCDQLRAEGKTITIETAGTLYLPLACDLMSISPKLSNSAPQGGAARHWQARHNRTRYAPQVVRRLVDEYPYQFKFVVGQPEDADEVARYLEQHPWIDRGCVMLMPEGTQAARLNAVARWLEPYCRREQLRFCPRKQIEWFGARRGT